MNLRTPVIAALQFTGDWSAVNVVKDCGIIKTLLKMQEYETDLEEASRFVIKIAEISKWGWRQVDIQKVCDIELPDGTSRSWKAQIREDLWNASRLSRRKFN